MDRTRAAAAHLAAFASFLALAVLYTWPLAADLSGVIAGPPGDSSLGVWNLWHFRRALDLGQNPLWTQAQYWPHGSNLLLHHYTLANDLAAAPFIHRLGVPAAYNALYLLSLAAAGSGTLLLARSAGLGWGAAWWAGAAFAFGPWTAYNCFLGVGIDYIGVHVIPFFAWAALRLERRRGPLAALAAGAALTWVWAQNYYYFLMCALMLPAVYLLSRRPVRLSFERREAPRAAARALELLAGAVLAAALLRALGGQRAFHGGGGPRAIAAEVGPFVAGWALLAARLALSWRPRLRWDAAVLRDRSWAPYAGAAAAWLGLNLPLVAATVWFILSGDYGTTARPWRGGGNPTELLWLLAPNRLNLLWGGAWPASLSPAPELGTLGLTLLALAAWSLRGAAKDALARLWAGLALLFGLLTLGPWLKLGGLQTYLPLPFYFLHLLPVYDNLQVGHKFLPFAGLFLVLIAARGLTALWARGARAAALAAAAAVLIECLPPRPFPTHPAGAPALLERLASRPHGGLLPIPFGAVFTGLAGRGAVGDYWLSIESQPAYVQPTAGGYISRVPRRLFELTAADPFLSAAVRLQEGGGAQPELAPARAAAHLRRLDLTYVLVNERRARPALKEAVASWGLPLADDGDGLRLYEVRR